MKPELFLLKEILKSLQIKDVLDIGVGKGYASLFCASYGAKVDAIDNSSQNLFMFPPLLKDHPNITFYETDINDFNIQKKYDLIILTNIIMFLKKEIFMGEILPQLVKSLNNNGYMIISFFLEDDISLTESMSKYKVDEFSNIGLTIEKSFDKNIEDNHPPYGQHNHHVQYILMKNTGKIK